MRRVCDIMTEDVATASPDTTLDEIACMMRDEDTGAIPVVDEDELIGIITDRDIVIRCIAQGKVPSEVAAEEIVSEGLEVVEPEADAEEAARIMARRQIRRIPVVKNGRLVGMVSLGDIAVKVNEEQAGETLEEVSHGVKSSRQAAARKQAAAVERLEQERGERKLPSAGRGARQEISNRAAYEEEKRQSKVVPIRNQAKTAKRRRAG
jgi:CBS domain-containing protein